MIKYPDRLSASTSVPQQPNDQDGHRNEVGERLWRHPANDVVREVNRTE